MSDFLKEEPIEQFPEILKNIKDIQHICNSEKEQYIKVEEEIRVMEDSQFILTASKDAVIRYEKELRIKEKPGETLQFRRERILNRINLKQPYTKRSISKKLDEIIGENNWKAYINREGTRFILEAAMSSEDWYTEFKTTMEEMKPASVLITIKPYKRDTIKISTSCTSATCRYNLDMSGYYEIGSNLPMGILEGREEVDRVSNSEGLINESIQYIFQKITKIKVNDSVIITNLTKEYDLAKKQIEIAYSIEDESLEFVTNIKLLGNDNFVYQESQVYIPFEEGMEFREIISFEEVKK